MADDVKDKSIQARGRGEVTDQPTILQWLTVAGTIIAPWWSQQRDRELRQFWKKVDHIAGAIYTFQSRLSTIPFKIVPRDMSFVSHQRQAEKYQEMLLEETQFGMGWNNLYEPYIEDVIGQDNGGFLEIIGDGKLDGPIVGPVLSVAHLDARQCTRTADYEFPVIFTDPDDGTRYKLHRTRVLYNSQMPSADTRMNGVGVCALSRCINVAQNIYDILVYKQEKLGSRPQRAILLTGGGLTPSLVASAFAQANEAMKNQALSKYSKVVGIGSADAKEATIELIDLAGVPDGFDEQTSMTLGMATVALAFGVDARELFPAMSAGATKAEALVQHLKQRGKGFGQFIQMVERGFNQKILPPHLKLVFDFQDDAQDLQVAEIKGKRAETRFRNLQESGVTDTRTERENMLKVGDLTEPQFNRMELDDGRLPNGVSVLSLFTTKEFTDVLDLGVENPFDTRNNDKEVIMDAIADRRAELTLLLGEVPNVRIRLQTEQALSALQALEEVYEDVAEEVPETLQPIMEEAPVEESIVTPVEQTEPVMSEELEEKGFIQRLGERIIGGSKNAYEEMSNMDSDELYYAMMLNNSRKKKEASISNSKAIESLVEALQEMASQPTIIEIPEIKVPDINIPETVVNVPAPIVNIDQPGPVVNIESSKDTNSLLSAIKSLISELRKSTKQKPPKVEVNVKSELAIPDHEIEVEKVVERDSLNRIKRTVATRKIVKK